MTGRAVEGWAKKTVGNSRGGAALSSEEKGALIMRIADAIRPWIEKMLDGTRDNDGILPQPAEVYGISIRMAQWWIQVKVK